MKRILNEMSAFTRREWLMGVSAAAIALAMPESLLAQTTAPATKPANLRYKIAACDWMMLKRQTPGAITRAKEVGCDGVETDMGPLSKNPTFNNKFLQDPEFVKTYLQTAQDNGIEICSLAMSGFYAQAIAKREVEQPFKDTIATMKLLGVKTAFLPLGIQGDLVKYPELRPIIVERIKLIGKWAEEAGVIIGIETALDAAGDIKLLEEINSPNIKIYFNFANAWQNNRDVITELQTLGKDRICQIHCTNEDGFWLQDDPKVNMPKIKETLDAMGWSGWLVIERSRKADRGRDVVGNFGANARYLKSVFQA